MRASSPYLAGLVALVCLGNFFWFIGESLHFGGSALNGYQLAGQYYLGSHGGYTAVSQAVWEHIRLHEVSVLLSVPLFAICSWYWLVDYTFPRKMGLAQGKAVEERVLAVQASGLPLASGRCGAIVAGMGVGLPLFTVAVYPGGITFRFFPQPPIAVLGTELIRVEGPKRRYGQARITHSSPDIRSPIVLYIYWNDLAGALDWLAAEAKAGAGTQSDVSPERSTQ